MHNQYAHPIPTGLMAYGMSGKVFHAPFLKAHDGFLLSAVVERNKKLARADYPEIKSYATIDELLADKDIELVIVNTPNYLHFEHAKAALLAGKHILVEKPFTASSNQAQELFDLGKKLGLNVLVYQNRRYSSDFLAVKKVIEQGRLGNIIEANFRFDRYRAVIGPKAFKETPFPASGILYDLGAHLLDQVICLFGKPSGFSKTTGQYRENASVDDYGHIHLKYPGQKNVFVTVSLLTAHPLPATVIHGTQGSFIKTFTDVQEAQSMDGMTPNDPRFGIEAPGMEGQLTCIKDGIKIQEKVPAEKGNMLGIFEAVYRTIRDGQDFPVKQEEIITQLEILEAL